MQNCMREALTQIYAGLAEELPNSIDNANVEIEYTNRQCTIKVEENGTKFEESMLANRLHREANRRAEPPLNNYEDEDESETRKSSGSGSGIGSDVRSTVLNS